MDDELKNELMQAMIETSPPKRKSVRGFRGIIAAIVAAFVLATIAPIYIHHQQQQQPAKNPLGEITLLKRDARNSRQIIVAGYTKNLPPERPYPVLAVDVEHLRLCWPKSSFIRPNMAFQFSFHEGGPGGKCSVSLYAVNHDYYKKVIQWFDEQRFGGMPLLPISYRIDTKSIEI